jgi:hypothetical protein
MVPIDSMDYAGTAPPAVAAVADGFTVTVNMPAVKGQEFQ